MEHSTFRHANRLTKITGNSTKDMKISEFHQVGFYLVTDIVPLANIWNQTKTCNFPVRILYSVPIDIMSVIVIHISKTRYDISDPFISSSYNIFLFQSLVQG